MTERLGITSADGAQWYTYRTVGKIIIMECTLVLKLWGVLFNGCKI